MSRLKNRVEKLEHRAGTSEKDSPVIGYIYDHRDGEEGAAKAQAEAVAIWEAKNGPLGNREPFFIERWIILNPETREAEQRAVDEVTKRINARNAVERPSSVAPVHLK